MTVFQLYILTFPEMKSQLYLATSFNYFVAVDEHHKDQHGSAIISSRYTNCEMNLTICSLINNLDDFDEANDTDNCHNKAENPDKIPKDIKNMQIPQSSSGFVLAS